MFETLINNPGFINFLEVLNPLIIVFTLVYAILNRIKLFDKKNIDIIISLVMGLLFVLPHVFGIQPDFVPLINILIPSIVLILIMSLSFLLIISFMGIELNKTLFVDLITILIIFDLLIPDALMIAWISKNFGINFPPWLQFLQTDWFFQIAILLAIFGGLIYYITNEEKSKKLN